MILQIKQVTYRTYTTFSFGRGAFGSGDRFSGSYVHFEKKLICLVDLKQQ